MSLIACSFPGLGFGIDFALLRGGLFFDTEYEEERETGGEVFGGSGVGIQSMEQILDGRRLSRQINYLAKETFR